MTDSAEINFTPSPQALAALADLIPALVAPDASGGQFAGLEPQPDGTLTSPHYDWTPLCQDVVDAAYGNGFVVPFDWPEWSVSDEARGLMSGHADELDRATPEQITRVMTAVLRSDRLCEGTLSFWINSGRMLRVAERARALVR